MEGLKNLVYISWSILAAIVASSGLIPRPVSAGLRIHAEQVMGTLLGQALLRCTVNPPDQQIYHVQWFKDGKEMYFDTLHPNPFTKPGPGFSFEGREITGAFELENSAHDLKIERPVMIDEGLYRCAIYVKTNKRASPYNGYVNLTLVVPTDIPASITDVTSVKMETSNCSDSRIPVNKMPANSSFVCSVGGSKPGPSVEWYHNGSSRIHTQISATYFRRGVPVQNASRQIDVLTRDSSIKCVVLVPGVKPGAFEKKEMCLIVSNDGMSSSPLLNQSLVIGLLVGIPIALLSFCLSIILVRKYKTKRNGQRDPSKYLNGSVREKGATQNPRLLDNPGGNQESGDPIEINVTAEKN